MNLPTIEDGSSKPAKYILLAAASLFALTVKFGFHECWKDEWQAWLMARDMGWGKLYASLFYEGHPAIWYFYLKIWTYLAQATKLPGETLLHLSHWLVVTATWAVLVFRLRMAFWVKALALFGYFIFFEYGILDRGYAFVLLFGFLGVSALEKTDEKPWTLGIYLFLLCQTEVFGVIMAACLWFHLLQMKLQGGKWQMALHDLALRKTLAAFAAGVLLFVATVFPRAQHEELGRAYTSQPFSADNFATAFQGDFANTFLIGLIKDTNVFGVSAINLLLSALVVIALAYFFWPAAKAFWTFFLHTTAFFLFGVAIYPGGLRQWGMQYAFFLMALALSSKETKPLNWQRTTILAVFLGAQLLYNLRALQKDVSYPFTNAEIAGEFIRKNVPENVPIVAINKFAAAPVSGYARRPFYELPNGMPFTYFKWLEKVYLPTESELRLFAKYKGVGGIVIVTDKELEKARYPNAQVWKPFDGYNVKNENYYLYALKQ
ncbi:MAG: hypothetical protein IT258_00175 [Saprospiraceae bacterium]|nr:hypothetical protein [Saprospiraceae bacterium]